MEGNLFLIHNGVQIEVINKAWASDDFVYIKVLASVIGWLYSISFTNMDKSHS